MKEISLTLDGIEVKAEEGATVLEAALGAGIYIPALCAHPDLLPAPGMKADEFIYCGSPEGKKGIIGRGEFEGCGLCVVEINGVSGFPLACDTPIADGIEIRTESPLLTEIRRERLASILANHPHACLVCSEREGCSREPCSLNVPVEERCCPLLGRCELQKVAEYIGIKEETPRYIPKGLPVLKDEPLFIKDYNLCIGCTRCVRVCKDVRGVGALGFVLDESGEVIVGTIAPSLRESGCKFCTSCVEVCPTGALMDKLPDGTIGRYKEEEKERALVPCAHNCPAGIEVPRYIRLVADGRFEEAAAVIGEKVPFPSVLGRVCFHPCEENCRRGEVNEPVAICAIKRFVADVARGEMQEARGGRRFAPRNSKFETRVAIVGSGPCGLTAAYYLAGKGHLVTVFESEPEPGGMMRFGIPEYRLPKEVLQREIEEIRKRGVEIKTSAPISSLHPLRGFDAIFLAVGAQLPKKLHLEGAEMEGVILGLDFLRKARKKEVSHLPPIVTVIGGGNVAVDVALTSIRLGAKEVQLVCLESREEMPAFEWEIKEAIEEGVVLNCSWGPKRIIGDCGKVAGIELVRCVSVFDEEGNFNPTFDESVVKTIEADMVILAIGQVSDLSFLSGSGIQITSGGTIKVNEKTLETDIPGVFAGGEVVSGPSSVVEAIAMGKQAAISIDEYLGGDGLIEEPPLPPEEPESWLGRDEGFSDWRRVEMPRLSLDKRRESFAEVELGFDEEMAIREAKRCLRCDLRLRISPVVLPPEKWLDFTIQNVEAIPETEGVYQLLDETKTIIYIAGTPNLREELEEHLRTTEPVLSKARYFGYEEEPMYTRRESELLQQFLQEHGRLPEGNDLLEELF